jgi:glycosyltransferase involved in cell wall biosynthesis
MMQSPHLSRVLITGGHEVGGVASFAEGLRAGFSELGIHVEIIRPSRILSHWRELRNPRVLKILSTTAVFAAPFARRAICMAHGVPRADCQGWGRVLLIVGSYKLANLSPGALLVSVSHYTAATLRALFNVRTDAVVHNPAKALYLEPCATGTQDRCHVTYVGRLVGAKNLHRILPAVRDLLDEKPGLRMAIVGDGEQRAELEAIVDHDPRFEFIGSPDDNTVRDLLRRTRIFVSGNEVEGFGIAYLEAMTQGCIVVMPASGGGLEIAPEAVGRSVLLMPLSWDRRQIHQVLRRALDQSWTPIATAPFTSAAAAESFLLADSQFPSKGRAGRNRRVERGGELDRRAVVAGTGGRR